MNCWICNSPSGARIFAIHVDGEPLRLQPVLCGAHGDAYLLRVGRVIGELLRDHSDPSQSGHTISEPECGRCGFSPCSCLGGPLNRPLPDKSGYSCHWFTRRDRDYYCDQGEGHQGPHHNANVPDAATWVDRPPDGVWLDSDGIPGAPVAKKP